MKTFTKAVSSLTVAHSINPQIPTPLLLRSIVNGYCGSYDCALQDIDNAIEKCEDNIPIYFYVKGVLLCCYGDIEQAVNEFSVCINLDENYYDAYIQYLFIQILVIIVLSIIKQIKMFLSTKRYELSI